MKKNIQKIAVVGSGTAGLVAALILKTRFENIQIDIIHSSQIGILGVGEGSTEHFQDFIEFVGISHSDLIKHCGATYKLGIMFDNWTTSPYFHSVQHPFNKKVGQYSYVYAKQIGESKLSNDLSSKITWNNQINSWFINKPDGSIGNQFHFDTHKLNTFLTNYSKNLGINFIDDDVENIILDQEGYISTLRSKKDSYSYDFYIDCTGFNRLLIGKLGAKWVSYKKYLKMKEAIVFQTEDTENYNIWTLARAMDNGWLFRIPVQCRHGNGYIYDSDYTNLSKIEEELETLYKRKLNFGKQFKFDPGALDRPWIKNCCAIGVSGSFFEPLEASSIGTSIQQSFLLMHYLINYSDKCIDQYNKSFCDIVENIRDFIALHYITNKTNTEFWKSFSNENIPDTLLDKMKVWKYRLPVREDFNGLSNFILFKEDNFTLVLDGLRLFDNAAIQNEYSHCSQQIQKDAETTLKNEEELYQSAKCISHKEYIEIVKKYY